MKIFFKAKQMPLEDISFDNISSQFNAIEGS